MDDLIHREVLIGKLLLFREVIFQSRPQLRGTAIEDGRAIQHPFFLRDVVIPNAACVRIDAGEQLSVNGKIFIRCEAERSLGQERSDSGRDLVGLLRAVLRITGRILFVIGLQERIGLFKGYLALDIADGGMHQIIRCLQPVNCLQANGRMPSIALVPLVRLRLSEVFFERIVVHPVSSHFYGLIRFDKEASAACRTSLDNAYIITCDI